MDNQGKISLDMLIGISIFLTTFIFIAQFLPSVFAGPREEISLGHEAYKVAVLLSENKGDWSNGTVNGTGWENHWSDPNVRFLPGLASEPNCLNYAKIRALKSATSQNYTRVKEMLGLKTPRSDYDFRVSLQKLGSRPYDRVYSLNSSGGKVLDVGEPIPSTQVVRYERLVWLEEFDGLVNATRVKKIPSTENYDVNVHAPLDEFIVDISEAEYNNASATMFLEVKVDGSKVFEVPNTNNASEIIGEYDLTDEINGNATATGTSTVTIRLKNCGGKIMWTNAGEYMAGRIAARLVVNVW